MVADIKLWRDTRTRILTTIKPVDFKTMCVLHSRYFAHKYSEPCTCNKKIIRLWIKQLDELL